MNPCGKHYHNTPEAAAAECERLRALPTATSRMKRGLSVYCCSDCEGWHVGTDFRLVGPTQTLCIGEAR